MDASPPPRTHDTDLLVVGGGPAGCAAALMAASVTMRSVVIEAERVCHSLHRIPVLNNVLGGFAGGPELADAIAADLKRTELCRLEQGRGVTEVRHFDDHVAVTLDCGRSLTAPYAVLATGVGPLQPTDADWISRTTNVSLPPLWDADPVSLEGRTVLALGADRPLGTFLRANPHTSVRFLVPHPTEDDYKTEEVAHDPRVTLIPLTHLSLVPASGPSVVADVTDRQGVRRAWRADVALLNIGSVPAPPEGDLVPDASGYCPPSLQHPRITTAGDLRSPRFQRVMTATGSGAEAALWAYYAMRR